MRPKPRFETRIFCSGISVLLLLLTLQGCAQVPSGGARDRAARVFRQADQNRDQRLSFAEWNRRGNFALLDQNNDQFLSLPEVRALYQDQSQRDYRWPPLDMPPAMATLDRSVATDRVGKKQVGKETICALARLKRCGLQAQSEHGLLATGTGPIFPAAAICRGIDDFWAMDYSNKRRRKALHGGIDIPAPWGEPIRAVAAGAVVAIYRAEQSKRGNELVLRHSPQQTGLPFWSYSAYGHLDRLPEFRVGQKVAMGQIIGPTGNSGISALGKTGAQQSKTRRPALHLAMFYSDSPEYTEAKATIVPKDGFWLDPMAFYRQRPPYESVAVKALPEAEKGVRIPVLLENGRTIPPATKVIWPYRCRIR